MGVDNTSTEDDGGWSAGSDSDSDSRCGENYSKKKCARRGEGEAVCNV